MVGRWPNELYYSTNPIRYVGRFVKHIRYGYGDGGSCDAYFDNNGKEERVGYTYEGTTCFREVSSRDIPFKNELINKVNDRIPTLFNYLQNKLSTEEVKDLREFLKT